VINTRSGCDSITGLLREKMLLMGTQFQLKKHEFITGECLNVKSFTALIYEYGIEVAFAALL